MPHRVSPEAEAELLNIWCYVAKEAVASTLPTGSLIRSPRVSIFWLATLISAAAATRNWRPGLRSFAVH
jgi:hypothetical protein